MRLGAPLATALLLLLFATGAAGALDGGPEIPVNETTAEHQSQADLAATAGGGFAVAWQSDEQDGDDYGVYVRRLDSSGSPTGGEIPVNATTVHDQSAPSIDGAGGGFAVAWQSDGQDGDGYGVYARRFDSSGSPTGGEIPVNTTTVGGQSAPDLARTGAGFTIVWSSYEQDGDEFGVYARRFDAAGNPLGGEIPVNTTTAHSQYGPRIAGDGSGGFMVVWTSREQDGDGYGVYARRFDSSGSPTGGEVTVNTTTVGDQDLPTISALAGGGFAIAWTSLGQDGDGYGVYARRFDSAGNPLSGEIRANATTDGGQDEPVLTADVDGFAIVWMSDEQDGDGFGVYARRFDSAGGPRGGEVPVNTTTEGGQYQPAISPVGAGLLVAWNSYGQDGDKGGIFARRFVEPPEEEPTGPPPAPAPLAAPDTVAPVLWGLRLTPRIFALSGRANAKGGARSSARGKGRRRVRRLKRSTLVRYKLSEPGAVQVRVQRGLPGRRKAVRGKRRCVKPTRDLVRRKAKRCLRFRALKPPLTRPGTAGPNGFRFAGRLGRRTLSPGRYRLLLRATDAAGNSSGLRRRVFRIVRVGIGRRSR